MLALRFGLRVQEVDSTMHPYLTWAEGIKLAGQTFPRDVAKASDPLERGRSANCEEFRSSFWFDFAGRDL